LADKISVRERGMTRSDFVAMIVGGGLVLVQ
jgi:hypothetical protein